MLNYDFILTKAKTSQIDRVTIEREYWQLLFLQRLYTHKASARLFFKGGTAIRFLLGSFRFSEDLDFTSTMPQPEAAKIIHHSLLHFQKYSKAEWQIKEEKILPRFEESSLRYRLLFYPFRSRQKVSIRLDVSFREKPLTKDQTVLTPFDYPISPYPLVVHLKAEELMAEKTRALFVRGKPRDLFDLWFLLTKKVTLDQSILKAKFKIYPQHHFSLTKLKKKINGYQEADLKQDLNQFLPQNYRLFYQKLKTETLRELVKTGL